MKFISYLNEGGFNAAFFISPKGEIIYNSGKTHIQLIIGNPEKFGLNRDFIDHIHMMYNEKVGQEGKAREQILLSLFKQGWIRLRRYRNFWTVNIKVLTSKVKGYLKKWSNMLMNGKFNFKEDDPYIDVKIVQDSGKVETSTMKELSGVNEADDVDMKVMNIEDMDDLPLYDFAKEILSKGNPPE
jgi:hypothetical protein